MSTFLMTSTAAFFGSRAIRRFLGVEVRIESSSTRAVEERVAMDAGNVRSGPASMELDRYDRSERLDAVAGSEFVDDRIRLRE